MFRDISGQLSSRKSKLLNDPSSWHNIFHKEVVSRIDESVFSVLYDQNNGRPNASVRVLMGMIILKEGNGWSDEQLFDECRFNLKVMLSLGLLHIDEDVPVESTYYEFRRRLADYNDEHQVDLIKACFQGVTGQQIVSHKVNGEKIRMDSKLIQSNIAKSSRLNLIVESVRKSIVDISISRLSGVLPKGDLELLEQLQEKTTTNITFALDNKERSKMLVRFGVIIHALLSHSEGLSNSPLRRIFEDHYETKPEDNKEDPPGDEREDDSGSKGQPPGLKPAKEVPSTSVQSIHDPEATFRSKGAGNEKQKISGYHANITETCDQGNDINLIIDVHVDKAHVCENDFLISGLQASEQVLKQGGNPNNEPPSIVNHLTSDGGYDSLENRASMSLEGMPHWNMQKNKGSKLRYQLSYDKGDNLNAFCTKTGQECEVHYSNRADKYVITHQDKTRRYLTKSAVDEYVDLQQQLSELNPDEKNLRANVESTIHQVYHRLLKRNKMKYRGYYKCQMYSISRAFWANFRRILHKEAEMGLLLVLFIMKTLLKDYNAELVLRRLNNHGGSDKYES